MLFFENKDRTNIEWISPIAPKAASDEKPLTNIDINKAFDDILLNVFEDFGQKPVEEQKQKPLQEKKQHKYLSKKKKEKAKR